MESETTTAPELTLEQALEQIEELTAKADELSEDLEYCRDQLFTLLQRESDVSEQSIIDAFRRIFEGLDSWIDEISTSEGFETEFKSQYNKNLTRSMEDRSKTLGLSWLCQDIGWLTRLGKLKTCRYAVLTLVVTRCLKENVFRLEDSENWEHIYPFGFPNMDVELLVQVQEAMASDDIQKGL